MERLVPEAMVKMALWIAGLIDDTTTIELLFGAAEDQGNLPRLIFEIMPDMRFTTVDWKPCERTFYQSISNHALFYSVAPNCDWFSIRSPDTVVDNCEDVALISKLLRRILLRNKEHLVSVPGYVIEGIEKTQRMLSFKNHRWSSLQ